MTPLQRDVLAWYEAGNVGTRADCMRGLGRSRSGKHLRPLFTELCESGQLEWSSDQVASNLKPIPIYRKAARAPQWSVPQVRDDLPMIRRAIAARTPLETAWCKQKTEKRIG